MQPDRIFGCQNLHWLKFRVLSPVWELYYLRAPDRGRGAGGESPWVWVLVGDTRRRLLLNIVLGTRVPDGLSCSVHAVALCVRVGKSFVTAQRE